MYYEVTANINPRQKIRSKTNMKFSRLEAEKYANETNKYYPNANARVVKR